MAFVWSFPRIEASSSLGGSLSVTLTVRTAATESLSNRKISNPPQTSDRIFIYTFDTNCPRAFRPITDPSAGWTTNEEIAFHAPGPHLTGFVALRMLISKTIGE